MYTDLVAHFYNQALTVNAETTPDVVLDSLLADDFTSVNGQGTKSKAALIGQALLLAAHPRFELGSAGRRRQWRQGGGAQRREWLAQGRVHGRGA